MKSIIEYINEAYLTEGHHIFKMSKSNAQKAMNVQDALMNFINHAKKRYSFNNKQDRDSLFKDFCSKSKIDKATLKEFGIISGDNIANLIIANKEPLEKDGWNFECIKSFDETEMQKEYKAWKNSDEYTAGKKVNKAEMKDADEETLVRTLVVYDANDPGNEDTALEYDFEGVRGKSTDHQVNMFKMDWMYATGLKYYDARPILLSNYLKKSDAELAKRDALPDDIIGKND